jgi:hypothetical protein
VNAKQIKIWWESQRAIEGRRFNNKIIMSGNTRENKNAKGKERRLFKSSVSNIERSVADREKSR